jgi:hypothetical protein
VAIAAQIRRYLRDQDIPGYVTANGTDLSIHYQVALIQRAPAAFIKQQGREGLDRLVSAGFETLTIEANDERGDRIQKTFVINHLISALTRNLDQVEVVNVGIVPTAGAREMVYRDGSTTGEAQKVLIDPVPVPKRQRNARWTTSQ